MPRNDVVIDCEAGRRRGCSTFCCRLIVRLTPEDRKRGVPGVKPGMNCVPKKSDGTCIHLDARTERCRIWRQRPEICRGYDCSHDGLLPVVLKYGLCSLVQLVTLDGLSTEQADGRDEGSDDG